ncbi:endonuclease/exonuclease/phosphatase family protein [Candidatus Gottesmanbacteria bacterium]|nr:endonuclease/exonuclease/phosphatase family protein [Candidatus Gottesmanbacteria bacterium]
MKIISLNIWGGILRTSLCKFLKKYSPQVDFFCLQEVYSSPIPETNQKGMHFDIYTQIEKILPNHLGYFSPSYQVDTIGKSDLKILTGLAIFVKKSIPIKEHDEIFIYRNKSFKPINNFQTAPRNLQFVTFVNKNIDYILCHFHGIWHPKTKVDTTERIEQANIIKQFLNRYKDRVILCGDFNLLPDTKSISILEKGMRNLIKEYNIKTTRNQHYKREEKFTDYIILSPEIPIRSFQVIQDTVSDHLPLLLEI